jgi:hypothetical protein
MPQPRKTQISLIDTPYCVLGVQHWHGMECLNEARVYLKFTTG